jgi:sigma-54 specific flagellar transcriptional regulator A
MSESKFESKPVLEHGRPTPRSHAVSFDCIGREPELKKLTRAYERARHGKGHIVFVRGTKGVGKTTLLNEYKRRCRIEGIGVLEAHCHRHGSSFDPILSIMRQASGYLDEIAPETLDPEAGFRSSRLVATMQALAYQHQNAPAEGSGSGQGPEKIIDALGEMLIRVSRIRPPIIVLHDLQRADATTRRLLEKLVTRLSKSHYESCAVREDHPRFRGLFLVSWQSADAQHKLNDLPFWSGDLSHEVLPLKGLEQKDVAALLRSEAVIDRFAQLTDGNPRKLQSMLVWGSPDADSVVARNMQSLSGDARAIVLCCALLDRACGPGQLRALLRLSPSRLGAALENALDSGILAHSVSEGEIQLHFRNSGDRDAALQGADEAEIKKWRRRIGRQLLAEGSTVAATEQLLLAAQSGGLDFDSEKPLDWRELLDLVLEAGDMLEVSAGFERAANLYRRALTALEYGAQRVEDSLEEMQREVADRLCRLLENSGQYAEALQIARVTAKRFPDMVSVHRQVAHLHLLQGHFDESRTVLTGAFALLEAGAKQNDPAVVREAAALHAEQAELEFQTGNPKKCLHEVETVLEGGRANAPRIECAAHLTAGKVKMVNGALDEAAAHYERVLQKARAERLATLEIRSLVNLGIVHLKKGQHAKARELYTEALRAAELNQDLRHQAFCLQNLAVLAHWRRDYATALKRFHEAVRTFQYLGNKPILAWLALDLGELYLELGAVDRAQAMAQLSAELYDADRESSVALYGAMLRGRLANHEAQFLKAKHHFIKARQMARDMDRSEDEAVAVLELARLDWSLGNAKTPRELLESLAEMPTVKLTAQKTLLLAEIALEGGSPRSRQLLLTALQRFEEAEDPDGQWRCQALLAQKAQQDKRRADARRWRRAARKTERKLRKSVPVEMLDAYLVASHRRPYLELVEPTPNLDANTEVAEPNSTDEQSTNAPSTPAAPSTTARQSISPHGADGLVDMVGAHPRFQSVLRALERLAPLRSTVLLRGESGTGKELAAQAVHALSPRAKKPLIKVNCGALVETLLLSELFGHERGSFTGATRRKKGRFELADGGTLFLDEIGDISPRTQVALLRVLQEKVFERVGGTEPLRVDVRIVCATNRNLEAMVEAGTFREDLYYRLKSLEVELPPLRTRGRDVLLLAEEFLADLAEQDGCEPKTLEPEAQQMLLEHSWPGNIRELQNVLRSCWIFAEKETISADLVSQFLQKCDGSPSIANPNDAIAASASAHLHADGPKPTAEKRTLAANASSEENRADAPSVDSQDTRVDFNRWYDFLVDGDISLRDLKKRMEKECIERALYTTEGNITQAARLLGMKRPRLSQLVKEHGLEEIKEQAKKDKSSARADGGR